jgi:hypothetical protein
VPHASLKILPGVNQNETPTLNEAGLSTSNLVRFIYDPKLGALIQKLGGWTKYFPNVMSSVTRALWAWEDTNSVSHLAVGGQNIVGSSPLQAQLSVITNGAQNIITPRSSTDNVTPAASTTAGSAVVTITDATTVGITVYDSVFIETHISVGGLVLFGQYPCITLGSTTYEIIATDVLGNPLAATSTTTTTSVALFTTNISTDANSIKVTLNNHGYSVGSTYPILVSTTVGGVTLYGNYIVQSVIDANNFTITAPQSATSSTTASINGGNARYVYSYGVGAIPAGTGYGIGSYGSGGYGTGTAIVPSTGTPIAATDWTLDNWGETLISVPINGTIYQPIYQYDPTSGQPTATVIPQAPTVNDGAFVAMPQRQIISWGSTFTGIQDPLLIRWCDVNNYYSWIGTIINQAGSYRIPKGSKIVGCIQSSQQGLVWTDLGLWSMQYIGPPFVYSFNEIGTACGLIARKAAASVNGEVYWMGNSQFFKLSGNGVEPVPCPIWDVIFQDLDTTNLSKIRVAVNSRFGEISWYYPTIGNGGEINAYVKYNVYLNVWDFGTLSRSAWIDQSVLGPPIGADPSSLYLYQHETSTDADGTAMNSYFQTGYFALSEANDKSFIDEVWPDMKWGYYGGTQNATVNLTFYSADFPGQTAVSYGPYALNQSTTFISPRIRGRLVSVNVGSTDVGSFWRIGNIRYRVQPDGKY